MFLVQYFYYPLYFGNLIAAKPMMDLRRLVQQRTSNSALLNWGDIQIAPISAKEIRHWLIEYQGERNSFLCLSDIPGL